jgi:hypothetical protein
MADTNEAQAPDAEGLLSDDAAWHRLVNFVAWVRSPEQREATSSLLTDEGMDRMKLWAVLALARLCVAYAPPPGKIQSNTCWHGKHLDCAGGLIVTRHEEPVGGCECPCHEAIAALRGSA